MESLFKTYSPNDSWPQILIQTGLYGYVLFVAANMIGDGAELLLLVPSYSSLVGSIVIPILGAVPDGMMVLCSGLGPDAQEQLKVGIGALAGSTIMLLTLPWILAVNAGRVSIVDGKLQYKRPKDAGENWQKLRAEDSYSLKKSGVGVGEEIRKNAKIMLLTSVSYLIIQVPAFMVDKPKDEAQESPMKQMRFENIPAQIGLATSIIFFFGYLYLMVQASSSHGSSQNSKLIQTVIEGIQSGKVTLRGVMSEFKEGATLLREKKGDLQESLLGSSAEAKSHVTHMCKVLEPFFNMYDTDSNQQISPVEFKMIMKDMGERVDDNWVNEQFAKFDSTASGSLEFQEFVTCIANFAISDDVVSRKTVTRVLPGYWKAGTPDPEAIQTDNEDDGEEEEELPEDLADLDPQEQQRRIKLRAFQGMFFGTFLVLLFSDPMCDMLGLIGDKSGVPKFYVSFVLAPLASNASELVAAMRLASKKTMGSMVNSLSSLEGAGVMNNTFCLGIFLFLIVYKDATTPKGLVWQFSAETISILVIEVLIAVICLTKRVQTLLDGIVIFLCYPLALVIVMILENVFHLD